MPDIPVTTNELAGGRWAVLAGLGVDDVQADVDGGDQDQYGHERAPGNTATVASSRRWAFAVYVVLALGFSAVDAQSAPTARHLLIHARRRRLLNHAAAIPSVTTLHVP